jgi:hypothetical protein
MKSIASTLRLALALVSLSFGLNSASAADKVPNPNPQIKLVKSDHLGSAFMLDHVVSYGSLSMALPHRPDSLDASKLILSKIAAGPSWKIVRGTPSASHSGYLSLFRATNDDKHLILTSKEIHTAQQMIDSGASSLAASGQ